MVVVLVVVVVCGSGGMRSLWCVWCGVVHVVVLALCERERGHYLQRLCIYMCINLNNVCGHAYFKIKYCKTKKSFIIDKEFCYLL